MLHLDYRHHFQFYTHFLKFFYFNFKTHFLQSINDITAAISPLILGTINMP